MPDAITCRCQIGNIHQNGLATEKCQIGNDFYSYANSMACAPFAIRLSAIAFDFPGGRVMRRVICGIAAVGLLTGCAVQRAQVASDAREQMLGLSKERVLACMGPPSGRMAEGATEVWSYGSGDGTTVSSGSATSSRVFGQPVVDATVVSHQRFCRVNVVMTAGKVSQVNYSGPTGGLLTAGEQCAYAVQNCVQ